MRVLLILIVLAAVAAGAYWYLGNDQHKSEVHRTQEEAARIAEQVGESVKEKLNDFSLSVPEIKKELERGGAIVRKKAEKIGAAVADATADARTTAAIKAKLVKDPTLSALQISVSTTDGVVTMSGSVRSPEEVSQALRLALETDGVREAISTLQVKPNQ